jgi:AcrR family transcriptional regulator
LKDKEKSIIDTSIKLFARKGFSSTSIQEIATESGISKGTFYLYFKSKDALLFAILQYYFEKIQKKLSAYENINLSPREKFIKQLHAVFETLIEHKEYIIMHSREQAIPLNEDIKELIFKMHFEMHQLYRAGLLSIYGEKIAPYIWDLSVVFEGLFQSYIKILLVDKNTVNLLKLTEFIMRRMDSITKHIVTDQPILSDEKVETLLNKLAFCFREDNRIKMVLVNMKNELEKMEEKEVLEISLEVIETEVNKENPRVPVIQGMLSNFKGISQLEKYSKEIASFYNFKIQS